MAKLSVRHAEDVPVQVDHGVSERLSELASREDVRPVVKVPQKFLRTSFEFMQEARERGESVIWRSFGGIGPGGYLLDDGLVVCGDVNIRLEGLDRLLRELLHFPGSVSEAHQSKVGTNPRYVPGAPEALLKRTLPFTGHAPVSERGQWFPLGVAGSVAQTEGPAALRDWLKGGPEAQPPLGLTADELQVKAAVKALKQAQGTLTGLKKETAPLWQAWVEAAMSEAAPPPPALVLRPLEPGELQKVLDACRDKKGSFDGDKAAKRLVSLPLDGPSLEAAITALHEAGAKPGHIGMLDKALKALIGGPERA